MSRQTKEKGKFSPVGTFEESTVALPTEPQGQMGEGKSLGGHIAVLEITFVYSQDIQYVLSNLPFGWFFYKLEWPTSHLI